jgi:hypothetical protein
LAESRALPNLLQHEARLVRRAEKLHKYLHGDARFTLPMVPALANLRQTGSRQEPEAILETENLKNEPNLPGSSNGIQPTTKAVPFRKPPQPGRNEPCSCGSRLKFKHCCLKTSQATLNGRIPARSALSNPQSTAS